MTLIIFSKRLSAIVATFGNMRYGFWAGLVFLVCCAAMCTSDPSSDQAEDDPQLPVEPTSQLKCVDSLRLLGCHVRQINNTAWQVQLQYAADGSVSQVKAIGYGTPNAPAYQHIYSISYPSPQTIVYQRGTQRNNGWKRLIFYLDSTKCRVSRLEVEMQDRDTVFSKTIRFTYNDSNRLTRSDVEVQTSTGGSNNSVTSKNATKQYSFLYGWEHSVGNEYRLYRKEALPSGQVSYYRYSAHWRSPSSNNSITVALIEDDIAGALFVNSFDKLFGEQFVTHCLVDEAEMSGFELEPSGNPRFQAYRQNGNITSYDTLYYQCR